MIHPTKAAMLPIAWLSIWLLPSLTLGVATTQGCWQDVSVYHLENALRGPELLHPFGFDAFGRDLLILSLQASARSAFFAAASTLVASGIGTAMGTLIAVASDGFRFLLSRSLETLLAFPSLLFSLAWAAVRGPGWDTLAVSLLLGSAPSLTRLIHVRAREVLAEDYVLAARSLGAGPLRIALRHLAPSVMTLCRVKAPNLFASALLAEATLSFLGLGAPIGHDTWGSLLAQGKDYLIEAPHLAITSGIPLVLTVICIQRLIPPLPIRFNQSIH